MRATSCDPTTRRRQHHGTVAQHFTTQSPGLFWPIGEEHRMQRSKEGGIIATCPPDPRSTESQPKPALYARIWARVLAALHESRNDEAARVIRRHRELIDNFKGIELSGPKLSGSKLSGSKLPGSKDGIKADA
jgi:hypothetical protein